jgi:hypothetical protein
VRTPSGFLMSPELLGNVRRTISKVNGDVTGSGVRRVQTRFEGDDGASGKTFRICNFTGVWEINQDRTVTFSNVINLNRTVTFSNVTATPNTVLALNLFAQVGVSNTATLTPCAIAKEGTSWFLIAARCG